MPHLHRLAAACLLVLTSCTPPPENAGTDAADSLVAITNVNVVSMDGEHVLRDHTVLVRAGTIAEVAPSARFDVPASARIVAGEERYLMPGLIDVHVHLRAEAELQSYLAYGVTTIVNLSGTTEDAPPPLSTRDRIATGELLGPALFTTGPVLDGDPPNFAAVSTVVTTPEAAEQAVAEQVAAGYDFIKVYNNLSPAVLQRAVATAHRHGRAVFGHIPRIGGRDDALQRALDAGLDVVAHGEEYFFTYFYAGVDSLLDRGELPTRDAAAIPDAVRLTREAGTAVIPNLSFVRATRWQLDALDSVFAHPEARYLPPNVLQMWHRYNVTHRPDLDRFDLREQAKFAFLKTFTKALQDGGVRLLLGTDTSLPGLFPGLSAHHELEELVAAGLSPYEALATGTRNAGAFLSETVLGAAPRGIVAPGYRADLVLVRANPLANVRHAMQIDGVMTVGRWLTAEALTGLRGAEAAAHHR